VSVLETATGYQGARECRLQKKTYLATMPRVSLFEMSCRA